MQHINPEGRPPSNLVYDFSHQKGSKNDQEARSKEESPSELANKQPFIYQKNPFKKQGYQKTGREFGTGYQENEHHQKYQYNELYDLGPEEETMAKETYPFQEGSFYRPK